MSQRACQKFSLNCIREVNEIDLAHVSCREFKNTVENMIDNYNPRNRN